MLQEPWITFILLFAGAGGVIAVMFGHMWLTERAELKRRARGAASHAAE